MLRVACARRRRCRCGCICGSLALLRRNRRIAWRVRRSTQGVQAHAAARCHSCWGVHAQGPNCAWGSASSSRVQRSREGSGSAWQVRRACAHARRETGLEHLALQRGMLLLLLELLLELQVGQAA